MYCQNHNATEQKKGEDTAKNRPPPPTHTHTHTRQGIREQFEQIRGQPHQYAQMTPIPETQDIEIEIKQPKRQKTIHEQAQKARRTPPADHIIPTPQLQ